MSKNNMFQIFYIFYSQKVSIALWNFCKENLPYLSFIALVKDALQVRGCRGANLCSREQIDRERICKAGTQLSQRSGHEFL